MGARELDERMRTLARHQWVREHGTPRVTTLAGSVEQGRACWQAWLTTIGRKVEERMIFTQPARAAEDWLAGAAAKALQAATSAPGDPVAILVGSDALRRWLASRMDRATALIGEGVIEIGEGEAARARAPERMKARSSAEQAMFEALQVEPSTAGRFQLNQAVSFAFGGRATEVDLLSRADEIAIEIDGYRHFTDQERYRRDRKKDLLLQANGYKVLRFLADDVGADPRPAVRDVVLMMGVGRGQAERRSRSKKG